MSKLKVLILVETLKSTSKISNTLILSQFFTKPISVYDTECEIVRLANRDIKSGVYTILTNISSYYSKIIFIGSYLA